MVAGLLGLLDDVVALSTLAAASVDDIAAQAIKTTGTAAGVVIDDAAVTPRYVVGFAAERELPIIKRIALGSLKNKILVLLPAAVILSAFAPWAITPLLMCGGVYLCFEGYEKAHELVAPHDSHTSIARDGLSDVDPGAVEDKTIAGAIRTDFILSAEIMAISVATVVSSSILAHGLHVYDVQGPEHLIHLISESARATIPFVGGAVGWLAVALALAIFGLSVGALAAVLMALLTPVWRAFRAT
jgi:predicted DNA repair protein MutK